MARTQESVAISSDGEHWVLLNASPEIRQQIESFPALHPKKPRHSPIDAIVLTNGDLDHCLGLLSLRESYPLTVYATDRVRRGFTEGNVFYRTLRRFSDQVTWRPLKPGREDELVTGLTVEAVAVPGKPPIHLEAASAPDAEDNVGVRIREPGSGAVLAYFSGVGGVSPAVARALEDATAVFFDGTFWSEDELPALGVGDKRAADMAHAPLGGPHGSLAALGTLSASRRILIHINNTNPLLRDDSAERAQATARGWEVAYDGMEVSL